ncbi:hypothetical protein HDF16_002770 [Granulicella aggregans]|jgi:hypothetical protein|uniref:Uncharacterized protein n=1 Tax=Granulicella aggregans TaxID=474949 RepID=A0A7W7ZED7_9BACT|nr:hypothetical protein [Granulicella aggregans]MBB5058064.1 hypothetical protein [Granulicella aggregans]
MVLTVNGAQLSETRAFPTAAEVMGPQFRWMSSHPGDTHIPFNGVAPEGVLAMRIFGSAVSQTDGESHFSIPAGGHVIVAITASDNRDNKDYYNAAISGLQHMSELTVAVIQADHVASRRQFWSKSFVEIRIRRSSPGTTVRSTF